MSTTPNLTELAMTRFLGVDPVPPGAKKIRIKVTSRTHGQVVHGTVVEFGEQEYEIYDVHLPAFRALVEEASKLDRAREQHEINQPLYVAAREGKAGAEWRHQYEPSVEASFRTMFGVDVKPFDAVEVLDAAPSRKAA